MTIAPGSKLGPYEVLAPLGAGGMGEVWKARDTRLERLVAIKVLPPHIAKRDDLRARFEREARAVSSLNHPNICTLYDVGVEGDTHYMVLEHLEGETIAARVQRGGLPLEEVLKLAAQIGDALDRAHRGGVVHRDMKPANVMLTRDGAKVLDFGLARTMPKAGPGEDTLTAALTVEGSVMGTPQYMAPEQYEGTEADARSDVFGFGCVLYEMVTGKRAFEGKTRASVIGAVLSGEPTPMKAPPPLERIVKRCLAKAADDRYQSMRDVVLDLRSVGDEPKTEKPAPARRRWIWAVPAVAVAGAAIGWFGRVPPKAAEPPVRTFSFAPEGLASNDFARNAVISPNGRHVVYVAENKLWIRDLDAEQPRALEGTNGAEGPFWSPDSAFVGFVAGQDVKKILVRGGAPFSLGRLSGTFRGGAWSPDGKTILISIAGAGLDEMPSEGGSLKRIFPTKSGSTYYSMEFLPLADGRRIIVASVGTRTRQSLELLNLATGARQALREGAYPSWSATGHILYRTSVMQAGMWALPFSLETMKPTGEAFPVLSTGADFSASNEGTLLWGDTFERVERRLAWRDRDGKPLGATGQPQRLMRSLALAPDGTRVAANAEEQGNVDIWIHDLARSVRNRFTFDPTQDGAARWSPSGKEIAFLSFRSGAGDIFLQTADGSGEAKVLVSTPVFEAPTSWSSDGSILFFQRTDPKTGSDLWFMKRSPDGAFGEPVAFLRSAFNERDGQISPNGRYVLYMSDETGRNEIFVRVFPEGGKWQVSSKGGDQARWSRDGKEIFYVENDSLISVPVTTTGAFSAGSAKSLFRSPGLSGSASFQMYDVSPDGKRFILAEPGDAERTKPPALHVIENWLRMPR